MHTFILIGAGLNPERHLTREAIDAMRSARTLLAESYTSTLPEGWERTIERCAGRTPRMLTRSDLESGTLVLDSLQGGDTALLVPGDPLTATTHIHLIREVERAGGSVRVFPGISILTVVPGLLGLQAYKFGRTVSLPRWTPSHRPTSPLDIIRENLRRGLHTLILLDTEPEPMLAREAAEQILAMGSGPGALPPDTEVCVVARACHDSERLVRLTLDTLRSTDLGAPPHALVLPGDLHFMEREALDRLDG